MIDDGETFVWDVPSGEDPEYALLIATTIFCLMSNLMLPCFVSLGRRYEKRRIAYQLEHDTDGVEANVSEMPDTARDLSKLVAEGETLQHLVDDTTTAHHDYNVSINGPTSYIHGKNPTIPLKSGARSPTGILLGAFDKLIMPPYPDDVDGSVLSKPAFSAASSAADSEAKDNSTPSREGVTSFLDVGFGPHAKSRGLQQRRRAFMDAKQRRLDKYDEESAYAEYRKRRNISHTGIDDHEAIALRADCRNNTSHHSELSSVVSSHVSSKHDGKAHQIHNDDTLLGSESLMGAPAPSVLSRLDDHIITPGDAADADDPGHYVLPKPGMEGDDELDLCFGKYAWWKPSMIAAGFDRIVTLSEWDFESKRIVTLSIPFVLTALLLGINQTITVSLISQFVGTDAVVAFVIVELVLGLTHEFFGGIVSTEATLCSQAVGARNYKLAGQYVQICAVIYTFCMIPNIAVWSFFIDDVIILFGFDAKIAEIGHSYAIVLLFRQWLTGVNQAYHGLLNVIDREKWSTFISVLDDTVGVLIILGVVLTKETTLKEIALIKLGVALFFFMFNCCYTVYKGWMKNYLEGMIGSFALSNQKAVRSVLTTGLPVSLGHLIEYGEWEILTIFAAAIGPAEVAAWGLVGTIWTVFETLTVGIGNGGEVRCAYHLGAGNPGMAKLSAYKSVLIGVVASCFFTSILFMIGEDMAIWLSPDPTLQHLIAELLPLLGIGNIALTAGTVSWALVGSQGRYRLATLVAFICSWGITMPLSAIFTFAMHIDLQGITSAVVIGYSVTGTVLLYILLRSDWERLSQCVIQLNNLEDEELEQFMPEGSYDSSLGLSHSDE